MPVQALDHVNIRSKDRAATIAFFETVLGMARHPQMESWLLDTGGRPVIHVGDAHVSYPTDDWMPFTPADNGGAVHHVALECSDLDAMRARIEGHALRYSENAVPKFGLHQLFVREPGGVMLELNFRTS